jgi:Tat protein secretion system quality control protein TatD with DNase activity
VEPSTSTRGRCSTAKAVAVGETGVDYFRDYAPRAQQIAAIRS